jgi:hypothetical protein
MQLLTKQQLPTQRLNPKSKLFLKNVTEIKINFLNFYLQNQRKSQLNKSIKIYLKISIFLFPAVILKAD